jgi:uncharacterized DUF497 family protein
MISFHAVKRDLVLKRRGLDFVDAEGMFAGLHATVIDDRKDYGERRYISAGHIAGRMVVSRMDAAREHAAHHLNEALPCQRSQALGASDRSTGRIPMMRRS